MGFFPLLFLSSHDQRQSAGESSVVSRREDPVWADAAARWLVSDGGGGGGGLKEGAVVGGYAGGVTPLSW